MHEIPIILISIIAHGDYRDERSTYVTKRFNLSGDVDAICDFVQDAWIVG